MNLGVLGLIKNKSIFDNKIKKLFWDYRKSVVNLASKIQHFKHDFDVRRKGYISLKINSLPKETPKYCTNNPSLPLKKFVTYHSSGN